MYKIPILLLPLQTWSWSKSSEKLQEPTNICSLFLLMLTVPSAIGKTCCLPPQWQATELYLIGSSYNGTYAVTTGTVKAYFDNEMKRIAYTLEESSTRGSIRNEFTIEEYQTKTRYDIVDGQCTKSQIDDPYPNQCVSANATVELRSFIEIDKMNISTTRYNIQTVVNNQAYVTLIEEGCIPLSYQIVGLLEGANAVKSADVYSFRMGISNTTIFNVPAKCKKAKSTKQGKQRQWYKLSWFNV